MFCAGYNRAGEIKQLPDGTFLRYSSLKPVYLLNIVDVYYRGSDETNAECNRAPIKSAIK